MIHFFFFFFLEAITENLDLLIPIKMNIPWKRISARIDRIIQKKAQKEKPEEKHAKMRKRRKKVGKNLTQIFKAIKYHNIIY